MLESLLSKVTDLQPAKSVKVNIQIFKVTKDIEICLEKYMKYFRAVLTTNEKQRGCLPGYYLTMNCVLMDRLKNPLGLS